MSEDKDYVETEVVCMGGRILRDGKLGVVLAPVLSDEEGGLGGIGTAAVFQARKQWKRLLPGAVYRIQATAGIQNIKGDPRYLRQWPVAEQRNEWLATDTAAAAEIAWRKDAKSHSRVNEYRRLLAPVIEAYRTSNPVGRIAIELQLLRALRG